MISNPVARTPTLAALTRKPPCYQRRIFFQNRVESGQANGSGEASSETLKASNLYPSEAKKKGGILPSWMRNIIDKVPLFRTLRKHTGWIKRCVPQSHREKKHIQIQMFINCFRPWLKWYNIIMYSHMVHIYPNSSIFSRPISWCVLPPRSSSPTSPTRNHASPSRLLGSSPKDVKRWLMMYSFWCPLDRVQLCSACSKAEIYWNKWPQKSDHLEKSCWWLVRKLWTVRGRTVRRDPPIFCPSMTCLFRANDLLVANGSEQPDI